MWGLIFLVLLLMRTDAFSFPFECRGVRWSNYRVDCVGRYPVYNDILDGRNRKLKIFHGCFMNKNAISPDSEDDEEFYKNSEKPTMTEVEEIVAELEAAQPSTWMVMKDLLGVNIFTYILAALIALFFSLNILLGPGWLGSSIGMSDIGTINRVSDSLPRTVDLSNPDYLL